MARRRTTETAGPAAEAYAATLEAEAASAETVPGASAVAGAPVARTAAAPKRDARGRFARRGARFRKGGRPRSGRRGPSYLANRRQAALVRMCIVVEHRVGRLEAELVHEEWRDPIGEKPGRMKGIALLQADGQTRRLAALTDVLVDMDEERIPKDLPKRHVEIAERVTAKLGEYFDWRTLYRHPYRAAWRRIDDALATHAADGAATFADRSRWSKSQLVYRILRLGRRRDELLPLLRARLLEESADEDGWEPIPRRPGTG